MALYLLAVVVSFLLNFILIIPFINALYRLKFQRSNQQTTDAFNNPTPIYDKYHNHKEGTPVGGGILIIVTTLITFILFMLMFSFSNKEIFSNYPSIIAEIVIILFTFISFAGLGIYDDLNKMFVFGDKKFFGIRLRHKLIIEIILGLIISLALYNFLKIDIIHIPFFGVYEIGIFYVLFSTFVIVAFSNAVNITDGLDGLAPGILMIVLACFWVISRSILDVPTSLFIGSWLGGLISFLYFNIYPARIMLGDTGALSFGATIAVIGLILGKAFALPIIGAVFVLEIATSLIQLVSKRFRHKKVFPVAPLHLLLQYKGWEEPKIVMRLWLISIMCAIFGLMIAFMK